MDIDYRTIRPDDAAMLADFIRTVSGDTDNLALSVADTADMDERGERLFIEGLRNTPSVYAAAVSDGMIIGTCDIRISAGRARLRHRGEMAIAVRKDFWGRGIAQHLFEYAIYEARCRGVTKINLEIRSDNGRMRSFCLRNGFVSEGKDPRLFFIDGNYIDGERFGLVLEEN